MNLNLPQIDYPQFEVEVPSTKQMIMLRPMRVREEKILLMAREGDDRQEILTAIKQVVGNCIIGDFKIDDLTLVDIQYLFLRLRAQSVSNIAKVSYIDNEEAADAVTQWEISQALLHPTLDPKKREAEVAVANQGATYSFDINLDEVTVKFPEKVDKDIKVSDKVTITMKYPPASLYSDREFLQSKGVKTMDLLIASSIDKIYDGKNVTEIKKPDLPLMTWIDTLDVKSYDKIREFLNDTPTLNYEIKYTNKLGKERKIILSSLDDFFSFA